MPSLMVNRLRLLPMNGTQAYAVVTEAGGRLVDDEVARRLLQLTYKNAPDPPADTAEFPLMEIDPALLSVVCRELNSKRREAEPPLKRITAELMAGADREILKGFYERGMEGLDPVVRSFVEEELITQQGYRDSHDWEDALVLSGVTKEELELLIARRLLRAEERQGRRRLELTHDVLAKVVRDSRDNRRAREEEAAQAQEALAAVERERAAETELQLRTTRRLLLLCVLFGIAAVGGFGVAMLQTNLARVNAEEARKNAEKAQKLSDKFRQQETTKKISAFKLAAELKTANATVTRKQQQAEVEKRKAERLAGDLSRALVVADKRKQEAIEALNLAEYQKVQANTQRKLAEQKKLEAEKQKTRAEAALQEAQLERVRADNLQKKVNVYEGRKDLGNSQPGDGVKFIGRGYYMIVGRENYKYYGEVTGTNLIEYPEKAADPDVAAQIMLSFFEKADIFRWWKSDNISTSFHVTIHLVRIYGGAGPLTKNEFPKYSAYLAAIREGGSINFNRLPTVTNPEWPTKHIPAILRAPKSKGITDRSIIAFTILIADISTGQVKWMKEVEQDTEIKVP